MISRATYCTREDVNALMRMTQSSREFPAIDRAIESATRTIDKCCHRTFHPTLDTRLFVWPEPNSTPPSWRVWLDDNELISVTTVTSGGTVIPAGGYFLEPQASGPPYSRIETNLSSISAFSGGSTQQRSLSILGLFGYDDVTREVTTLSGAVASTGTAMLAVADGSRIGIGDLLKIGGERLIVQNRSWASTGQSLLTPLTASASSNVLSVSSGSDFGVGETLALDSEQMLITDIIADTLMVQRAVNATVLAAHTASLVYAPRNLLVIRGANGSTATTHPDGLAVAVQVVPAPIRSLAVAEAIGELQQAASGYARTAGSGDNERIIGPGPGLKDLREQVEAGYRRKARQRAV